MPLETANGYEVSDPAACVWRYMDFAKLIALLNDSALFFSRADQLSNADPFEGHLPPAKLHFLEMKWEDAPAQIWNSHGIQSAEQLRMMQKMQSDSFDLFRQTHFISCWHRNEFESDAMWQIYTQRGNGIAIKSSVNRLIHIANSSSEHILIGDVNYVDYKGAAFGMGEYLLPFIHKRLSFSHEQELRIVIRRSDDIEYRFAYSDGSIASQQAFNEGKANAHSINKFPGRLGISLKCDLSNLIECIYVAPNAPDWIAQAIRQCLKRYGYAFPVMHSELSERVPQFQVT